jgi:hypothetical protein
MLLCLVRLQDGNDCFIRETSDEHRAPRRPCSDIGTGRPCEGSSGDGLRRPGVYEA